MTKQELCLEAMRAMKGAYAPYSGFFVGAALLSCDGRVFCGCNIENASFSPTICAERCAFAKAVSEGVREFEMIAVCGGINGKIDGQCTPCGVCRQVMAEFCGRDFLVLAVNSEDPLNFKEYTLDMLLPLSFSSDIIK